jgi:hypothetical protein
MQLLKLGAGPLAPRTLCVASKASFAEHGSWTYPYSVGPRVLLADYSLVCERSKSQTMG